MYTHLYLPQSMLEGTVPDVSWPTPGLWWFPLRRLVSVVKIRSLSPPKEQGQEYNRSRQGTGTHYSSSAVRVRVPSWRRGIRPRCTQVRRTIRVVGETNLRSTFPVYLSTGVQVSGFPATKWKDEMFSMRNEWELGFRVSLQESEAFCL